MLPNILDEYSVVGIETGYELEDRVSIPGRERTFFSTPQCPHSLLSNGYRGLFFVDKAAGT
jgi:hypothetical protein